MKMFVSVVGNTRELQNLRIGNKEFEGVEGKGFPLQA